jgi:hypothetical protein
MKSLEMCDITMHLGSLRQTGPACRYDLDSHADASVVGMEVITFQDFERPVNVSGYDPKGPVAMAFKTVSAGMAYDVPGIGRVVILILLLIPQVRLAHKYPISPWEMIHPPGGDNPVRIVSYTVYTAVCNKSLTANYQCKIQIPSHKLLANNILNNN